MSVKVDADADVLIVGYGPVGQFLSIQLAHRGWSVAVVEKWPEAYPLPRAVHFDDEIGRLLQSIGIRPDSNPVIDPYDNFYTWRNADQEDLLRLDWSGQGRSGWATANFFSQPELEAELHKVVLEQPNIQVHRGWEAVRVDEDEDGVTLTTVATDTMGEGERRTWRGRYVVGADGANSFIRQAMDVPLHDLGFEFDWLIVDMVPDEPMTFDPPAWQWCNPENPTTLVPGGPGRRRWEFMRMPHESIEEMNSREYAWRRVAPWDLTPENSRMEKHAVYTFRARWAEQWRKGRFLIAGDAAHLMPPFAGQGMCAGLRDGANLAWRLDRVLSGASPDSLLDSYGSERISHVSYFIKMSMGLGNVICVSDPQAAAARDEQMIAALADPSLAPPPEAPPHLSQGVLGFHPLSGYITPQGRVAQDGQESLLDDLVGYGWLVLSSRPEVSQALSPESLEWVRQNGIRVLSVGQGEGVDLQDAEGTYQEWFAELGAEVAVIRPDFYLYDAIPLAGLDQTVTRLRQQLDLGVQDTEAAQGVSLSTS